LGGVTRLVGDNDRLLTVRRGENKATFFVQRDRRFVDCHAIHILLGDRDGLRRAIGLAIFNAVDHRRSAIQHDAVRADVGDISRGVAQQDIDNILVIGIDAEGAVVFGEDRISKLKYRHLPIGQQVFDCYRLTAVVSGGDRHRLGFLEKQTKGDIVEERFPTIFADFNFARGFFYIFPPCFNRYIFRRHSFGDFLIPTCEFIAFSCRVGRSGNCRAIVLRNGSNFTSTGGIKGYRVLIDFPLRIQGTVFRLVILACAFALTVAVAFAVHKSIIPATEKVTRAYWHRHIAELLAVGDIHGFRCYLAAAGAIKGHRVGTR